VQSRYAIRSRLPEQQFRRFLRHVAADLTVQIAQLTCLNRNTVNRLLACLHLRMAVACAVESRFVSSVEARASRCPCSASSSGTDLPPES
jgi:hypothetical protein